MPLTRSRDFLAALSITSLLVVPGIAQAGKATVESTEGGSAEIEYAVGLLRVGTPDMNGYMLMRDDTMYIVSLEGGTPMVFNASSMMKGMSQGATQMAPSGLMNEFVDLKDTGRNESIAGVDGDVYTFTFKDDKGNEQTEEVVLSDDERAIEFRDALFSMSAIAEDIAGEEAMEQRKDLQKRMESMDVGVLRYGQEMRITAISNEKIPTERFELPAEPMDMQGLGSMLGAMSQQTPQDGATTQDSGKKQGGVFSSMMGALGGKADRQSDRAGDAVDDKVDEKTDDAVDGALDRAFGKLFGR